MGRENPAPMIPVHVEPPKIGREVEEQLKALAQQAHEAAANMRALGDSLRKAAEETVKIASSTPGAAAIVGGPL